MTEQIKTAGKQVYDFFLNSPESLVYRGPASLRSKEKQVPAEREASACLPGAGMLGMVKETGGC